VTLSKKLFAQLIVVLAFLVASQTLAQDNDRAVRSTGTAFVVGTQGQLLTNNHVVNECDSVQVKREGQTVKASIVSQDDVNDLAILKLDRSTPGLAIRSDPPVRIGEQIITFGFPLNGALASDGVLTVGNVNALAGLANDVRMLQISVPVQPGNSGGPLLDL
jgi:serine protease Do